MRTRMSGGVAGNCAPYADRPAGRTFLEVKVLYTADMGEC
jgi:hypothetical protein